VAAHRRDLVERCRHGHPLAEHDPRLLYADGATGYTDYPPYAPKSAD
jgi:N-ethylmaleimide reductase